MEHFLKMSSEKICSRCGGRGSFQTTGTRNCSYCGGTGRNLRTNVIDSPDNPYCSSCNGKGTEHFLEWITCTTCYGSGSVKS